ncbi:hypothetical protein RvY_06714 [Ramazzottius varieornatus]|uniref:monoamine oxidase n=1 Tax=Ramazzottius varieornatus TaxID=947166 RepID=A0A1D1V2W0_RAMVA|nr:hypothetical protein RvY_06714 [Ramazzottius varieornatus]
MIKMVSVCLNVLLVLGTTLATAAYSYPKPVAVSPTLAASGQYYHNIGTTASPSIDCHIAILGAGFAGTYAAYQLSPQFKDQICVVEKLTRIGGRIHDVSEHDGENEPLYGLGPLRLGAGQLNMLRLARELGVEIELDDESAAVIHQTRGVSILSKKSISNSMDLCVRVFPTLNCSGWNNKDTDRGMWKHIVDIYKKQPEIVSQYADFTLFVRALVGIEGFEFLRAMTKFQSDFEPGNTAETIVSPLAHMTSFRSGYFYPKGGMSQYPFRMIKRAITNGARVFLGEAVLSIDGEPQDRFVIKTAKRTIVADRIINAIDPFPFRNITGNVAREIQNTAEFQSIKWTAVASVLAWWDDRFWEKSSIVRGHNVIQTSNHAECLNLIETPIYEYAKSQNATRPVYDDGVCVETWRAVLNSGNTSLLKEEIAAGMQRVFGDVVAPWPRTVKGMIHEQAWHNVRALSKFTNEDIRRWAIQPLGNRDVSMIGEAYHPAYSSWCEGALRSTMGTLQEHYDFSFPCLESQTLTAADCATH